MADNNKDSYSIDEMMERLREGSKTKVDDTPELITRPDGTQVYKVRKRKRRTRQPHKEAEAKRKKRILIISSLVTFVVLGIGLTLVGWVFYLNSSDYRNKVMERVSSWTGAEVSVRSFRATPLNAAADSMELTWPETSAASYLKVHHIKSDLRLSSHITGTWEGQEVFGTSGRLYLQTPKEGEPIDWPSPPIPFRAPVELNELDIIFGTREKAEFAVYDAQTSLHVPDPNVAASNLVLQNGGFGFNPWGKFDLEFASFKISGNGLELGVMRFSPRESPNAEYQVFGEGFGPVPLTGGLAAYKLQLENVPSTELLGPDLGSIFSAILESPEEDDVSRIYIDTTDKNETRIDCLVKGSRASAIKLYRFDFFELLSRSLDSPRLSRNDFNPESTFRVSRKGNEVRISELDLETEGLIRIQGNIQSSANRQLSGSLDVGIEDSILTLSRTAALPKVFSREEDGYRWATIQISGTTENPEDNLESMIQDAADKENPAASGQRGLEDEFRSLTTPGD